MTEKIKFNVNKFKNVIIKGTLDYCIDYLQLNFAEGRIKSSMVSSQRSVVTHLDIENEGIVNFPVEDNITLNFFQPSRQLKHFDIIKEEDAYMKFLNPGDDEKILISHGPNERFDQSITLWNESALKHNILKKSLQDDFPYFYEMDITEDLLENDFDNIIKVGASYGKLYIVVKDGNLKIETTDRNNKHEDVGRANLTDNVDIKDLDICFDMKNFIALTNIIKLSKNVDKKDFKMKFAYIEEREGGMIHVLSTDKSEQYFLLNRES